ncbi:MAG: hypothetical protein RLZZ450_2940 [Pseudomonadota bacterium]|jgi:hypothetical protein
MSTAIRPPGGPSTVAAADVGSASEIEATVEAGSASAVDKAGAAGAVAPASTEQVQSPTAALLARLDAGEITREQAIESLISEALSAPGVSRLADAQRTELESIVRASLLEDPTLARLLG